ncbi:type II toxin-antitoxin system PemK/MazF family toxin [Coprococcus comes]|uniref:type II toxin-antitoxin system PemK/MazF family toxin n=1 Tax=Coprococcus comes TaxID=410072 RepID=UPI001FACDBD6|nr:type II toxin-antitoxin system PemK/MazF family toxin [Coprococcus comes]
MKEKMICRGDLFYYDFGDNSGSVQSGERPVLVVQADDYNQNAPTIIVAAVTSVIKKRYLPSHIILGEEFGLKKPSMVLLEQIRTVNREDLREYIGTVDDDKLFRQINATLKKTFGLWVYKPEGKENIRCLCPKCLNDYIHNPDYIVRRLDPFAKRKDRCDKCDGDGWDYVVTDRYSSKKEKRCKSCREIAVEEGTYHSSVSKSIEAAKKNFKKFYENL